MKVLKVWDRKRALFGCGHDQRCESPCACHGLSAICTRCQGLRRALMSPTPFSGLRPDSDYVSIPASPVCIHAHAHCDNQFLHILYVPKNPLACFDIEHVHPWFDDRYTHKPTRN